MVRTCCVYKCRNRDDAKGKAKGLSFFRFPKDNHKRRLWIKAINRVDFTPNEYTCICSEHFLSGWHSYDPSDENYVPTLFAYKELPTDSGRRERVARRNMQKDFEETEKLQKEMGESMMNFSLSAHSYCMFSCNTEDDDHGGDNEEMHMQNEQDHDDIETRKSFNDFGVQCDPDPLLEENQRLRAEVEKLQKDLQRHRWSVMKIQDDDAMTKFYTGLPTFALFLWLFNYLAAKSEKMVYWRGNSATPPERTRATNTTALRQDVADRFGVSIGTCSQYFTTWLALLHKELKPLNIFPSNDIIKINMPPCFVKYPNIRVILDCTEVFVQRSSCLINQNLTFSHYKHHNTLKFLVGITPSGVISFVSEAYGGRISDRQITIESGILELLEPGDSVMADKGFTISDLLEKKQCSLNIPPFLSNSNQFSTADVLKTQEIAELRIHVERSIGRVKNYHIFDGVLPLSLAGVASQMFQVCCWLTNFDAPLVESKKMRYFGSLTTRLRNIGEIKKAQRSQFLMKMADGWSSDVTVKHHKKAYVTSVGNSDQAESVFYRLVEQESAIRKKLKWMNENLQNEIKNKIVQCIDNGLDDLRQVVKLFQQNSRTERCLKLLSDVDKMSIAETLIDGTSRTYFCPKVMGYEDIHGYRSMPRNITMDTKKPKKAGFKLLPGFIQDTKTKVAVVNIKVPGAMTLKKGMKITQTMEFGNLKLGFGYYRRNFLQQKTWGFYHKDQTQAC